MSVSIYTAYHAAAPLIDSASITPIHVGRARAATPLAGMIGDDTGDAISERNPEFCELTALYWAWKNDPGSDWIGLMHYRRVLDLTGAFAAPAAEVFPPRFDIPAWSAEAEAWIATELQGVDIVLPKAHLMGQSVAENYTRRHAPADWDATREIVARDHPETLAAFDRVAAGREIRLANMAILRRPLFEAYAAWLFDILFKLEAAPLDRSRYDPRQRRYLGFVAERLFTVWIAHLAETRPELRLHEVNIVNMAEAAVLPTVADDRFNGPEHVNIAFAADRAYVPHTAAMLRSMFDHADPARRINLFFLLTDVPPLERELLRDLCAERPHTTLTEIDVGDAFKHSYRSPSRSPSNATYNRFLLFDLLPGLERLLYVDVDMIFRGDVARIFDADLEGQPLGAVTDFIMTRVLTGATPTVDPDIPDLYTYQRDRLGLSDDQIARYFNAGLLLFDFTKLDLPALGRDLQARAATSRYLFRDQDILNEVFAARSVRLDPRFNVFNTIREGYNRVPQDNHATAMAARKDPVVIHYAAGDYKPWMGAVPMGQHYWNAIRRTPFYPAALALQGRRGAVAVLQNRRGERPLVAAGRALAARYPALRPALLGVYRSLLRLRR